MARMIAVQKEEDEEKPMQQEGWASLELVMMSVEIQSSGSLHANDLRQSGLVAGKMAMHVFVGFAVSTDFPTVHVEESHLSTLFLVFLLATAWL